MRGIGWSHLVKEVFNKLIKLAISNCFDEFWVWLLKFIILLFGNNMPGFALPFFNDIIIEILDLFGQWNFVRYDGFAKTAIKLVVLIKFNQFAGIV